MLLLVPGRFHNDLEDYGILKSKNLLPEHGAKTLNAS